MARGPRLANRVEHRVPVAVQRDGSDLLDVAAGFALPPELTAAARPVSPAAGAESPFERLTIRPREHENGPIFALRHDRDEPTLVELDA